jgi:hypothetical protein
MGEKVMGDGRVLTKQLVQTGDPCKPTRQTRAMVPTTAGSGKIVEESQSS